MVKRTLQHGSVLIVTVMALAVIAALAYLLNVQAGNAMSQLDARLQRARAAYLAEAGLKHHLWKIRQDKGNYTPSVNASLQNHGSYRTSVTPLNGSPVTITSTGTTTNGAVAVLSRTYNVVCNAYLKTTFITSYDSGGYPSTIAENVAQGSTGYLGLDNWPGNRYRSLMKFDLSKLSTGIVIASATLILDLKQADRAMDGATIYASRLLQPFDDSRANWRNATSSRDPWKHGSTLMPGGAYTSSDEGSTIITADATVFNIDITRLVDGWVNGRFAEGNNGILLHTNGVNGGPNQPFRLNSSTPRIEVKHC